MVWHDRCNFRICKLTNAIECICKWKRKCDPYKCRPHLIRKQFCIHVFCADTRNVFKFKSNYSLIPPLETFQTGQTVIAQWTINNKIQFSPWNTANAFHERSSFWPPTNTHVIYYDARKRFIHFIIINCARIFLFYGNCTWIINIVFRPNAIYWVF